MSERALTDVARLAIAARLNVLPFVRWDRFTVGDEETHVYGWIDRDDGRADFVVLDFWTDHPEVEPGFLTSSATLTEEIQRLLYPDRAPETHVPCQRVDEQLGNLVQNKVVLA